MKSFLLPLVAALFLSVIVIPKVHQASASAPQANADTLRQLEAEFMKATAERGSQGYLSYYAEDAVEVPNNAGLIQGKANIAKTMEFLDVGADISSSGDMGYTYGTYEFASSDRNGKPVVDHGKYTTIWKKQKDGSWKVVLDMGNAGIEPPQ